MRNISCDQASAFGVRNPVRTVRVRSVRNSPLAERRTERAFGSARSAFGTVTRTEQRHLYLQSLSTLSICLSESLPTPSAPFFLLSLSLVVPFEADFERC